MIFVTRLGHRECTRATMHELLYKQDNVRPPRDEFYELTLDHTSDVTRPYRVRQTHYQWDRGRIAPTDHIMDLFKTSEEAADQYALRKRTLVAIGFTLSNLSMTV